MPGRSLLQNGKPLDSFIEQLQQCRQLRNVDEKRCKALVKTAPCSHPAFSSTVLLSYACYPHATLASELRPHGCMLSLFRAHRHDSIHSAACLTRRRYAGISATRRPNSHYTAS